MNRLWFTLLWFTLLSMAAASAQSFEVAALKFHPEPVTVSIDPAVRGNRVVGTASTLADMITYAYGVGYDQIIGGPGWVNADHYDLSAKAEGDRPLTQQQGRQLVQTLLAERFHLAIHRDRKEVPVYDLVIGKSGHRLKPAAEKQTIASTRGSATGLRMEYDRGTIQQLTDQLSFTAGRPIVDKTGLTGYFAFTLEWWPANRIAQSDSDVPSMFTAVQEQLGLKLESSRGNIETLVIDRAEKPSGN